MHFYYRLNAFTSVIFPLVSLRTNFFQTKFSKKIRNLFPDCELTYNYGERELTVNLVQTRKQILVFVQHRVSNPLPHDSGGIGETTRWSTNIGRIRIISSRRARLGNLASPDSTPIQPRFNPDSAPFQP